MINKITDFYTDLLVFFISSSFVVSFTYFCLGYLTADTET